MLFSKGSAETWEEWGRRIVAEGARRTAERAAEQGRHAASLDKRARFRIGWELLEQEAAKLAARLPPAVSTRQLDVIDAHVLVADLRKREPAVSILARCEIDDPALRDALIPTRDGRTLAVVLVPGDWQVRALRVATIAAPEPPAEALS